MDYKRTAEKLFPADVFCAVIPPSAVRVFCDAKDEYDKLSRYDLQQECGEELREEIAEALRKAYEAGQEEVKNKLEKWGDIAVGKRQYNKGLLKAAEVADENAVAPASDWGEGAVYNAKKIAKAIRDLATREGE